MIRPSLSLTIRAILPTLFILPLPTASAQADATARFQQVDTLNSLDADDMRPWHMSLSFTRYDAGGNPVDTGTAEEWWAGKDTNRTLVTEDGVTSVRLVVPNTAVYFSEKPIDINLRSLLSYIVHPFEDRDMQDTVARAYDRNFGKSKATCLMLEPAQQFSPPVMLREFREPPLGLFPTYCVDDTNLLLVSHPTADLIFVTQKTARFLGHRVAMGAVIMRGNKKMYEVNVTHLGTIDAKEVDTSTTGLTAIRGKPALIGGGIMAGMLLVKVDPIYPDGAKRRHVSGTVVLRALIGADGRIYSLRVIGAPDYDLLVAAVNAVSRWHYRPYLLNGEPTDVDTTITVNFNLSPA